MKRLLSCFIMCTVIASSTDAEPFSPKLLKLSAPPAVQYSFDGSAFSLPVAVSGTPANVTFLVFTKGRASSVSHVTNGYLGWHYVNNIDTCLYVSPPFQFDPGSHAVTWDGKDENGFTVPPADYTYYIWGFDNVTPRVLMTSQIQFDPWIFRTIITHDTDGTPLSRPILYNGGGIMYLDPNPVIQTFNKWIIGDDPEDASLRETTTAPGWSGVGGIAFQPEDYRYYFYDTLKEGVTKITAKYEWVPNNASVLQVGWGINGEYTCEVNQLGGNAGPGVVSDGGDYLFLASADIWGAGTESQLIYLDVHTGTEIKRFDLSTWWVDIEDKKKGGQATGGPTELYFRNGLLGLGCQSSCLNQLIDPYVQTFDDAILWSNGNGDYTGDKNWEPGSQKAWVCNDYNTGPYKYNISMDENLFTVFPCFGISAESFGLYAPDGTGMGYHAISGESGKISFGVEFIDYGSAYDGIYTTNNDVSVTGMYDIDKSFWFVGHDSIKGSIITSGSYIFVSSPVRGEVWVTGMPHRIIWQANGVDTVRIEYSADGGSSWILLVDSINASVGSFEWTPAGIDSDKCLVRVTSIADSSIRGASQSPLTITPPFIKVTSPNGGEEWKEGETHQFTWSTSPDITAVRIEFSSDNGATWNTAAASIPASASSFSWQVQKISSTNCLVRVIDTGTSGLSDVSDGVFSITTTPTAVGEEIPRAFTVLQNHPNPFNPSTEIRFAIPERNRVIMTVYNLSGQKVSTLLDSELSAGVHTIRWDASGMSAGLYFCRVCDGREQRTIKMLFMK